MDYSLIGANEEEETIIELNVGGKIFSTFKSTLTKEKNSLLAAMVNGNIPAKLDNCGRYFVDCNPKIFEHILEYLRSGKCPTPEKVVDVYDYATKFGLGDFKIYLEQFKDVKYKLKADHSKESIDQEKYNQLLQDVLDKLSMLNENPLTYIYIDTVPNMSAYFPVCQCTYLPFVSINEEVTVTAFEPQIKTELNYTDDNLIRALAADLKSLGYGIFRYNKDKCPYCNYGNRLRLLPTGKHVENTLGHLPSHWKPM